MVIFSVTWQMHLFTEYCITIVTLSTIEACFQLVFQSCGYFPRRFQASHQSGEHEVNLSIFGGNYTVDFDTMQQINDDTGTARHVQRKANMSTSASSGSSTCSGYLEIIIVMFY